MKRHLLFWGSILGFAVTTTGCVSQASRGGLTPGGANGSVLASVDDSIDAVDRDDENTTYHLKCDQGVEVKHSKIVEDAAGKKFLQFDGKQIKDGAKCSMEVRNAVAAKDLSYAWYAKKNKNSPGIAGILYVSNQSVVKLRKLSLTIHKAYSKKQEISFPAKFAVSFAGESALTKAGMLAEVSCGEGDAKFTQPSDDIAFDGDSRNAEISINLPVQKASETTCTELRVSEKSADGVSVTRTFASPLTDVAFTGENKPEQGKELSFPAAGSDPYLLKLLDDGPIDTTIMPGECFNIIIGAEDCRDQRVFDLPYADNYLVAYVKGKTDQGRGEPREYIIGIGEHGFGALKAGEFNVDMLNKALASDDELVRKSFSFWKGGTAIKGDIAAGKLLNSAMVSGDEYAGSQMDPASLADIKFLHVENLWVHGFHKVSDINAEKLPASWLAVVEAKKGETTLTYIVGGSERGFVSNEHPVQPEALISFGEFAADAADGNLSNWQALQVKSALGDETACELESVGQVVNAASLAVVIEEDALGGRLAACNANLSALENVDAADYEVTLQGYRLGWSKLVAK